MTTAPVPSETARVARGERGAVTVLVAAAMVLLSVLALLVVRVGAAAWERSRAQAAADAAALAWVVDGASAANDYAARNGGTLVGWLDDGDEVEVVVVVGGARATARAHRLDPSPPVADTAPGTVPIDTLPVDTLPLDLLPVDGTPPDDHPSVVLYALPASGL